MAGKNDALWLEHFEEYKSFVFEEGRFPPSYTQIGQWFQNQIIAYKGGFLPDDRLEMLNSFNPVWCGDREAKFEENKRLLFKSNWKAKVPEGHTPIDRAAGGEDLYHCLKRGIYSCETYFEQYPLSFDFSKIEINVFNVLFPNLDYACTYLLSGRYGEASLENNFLPKWLSGVHFSQYDDVPNPYKSPEDMRNKIDKALKIFSPREANVLILHYGLKGYAESSDCRPKTYEEIGKVYNCSRERSHQVAVRALRKLRHPRCNKSLFFSEEELKAREREGALLKAEIYASKFKSLTNQNEVNIDYSVLTRSIGECNFSVRTFNCLYRAGFRDIADLLEKVNFYSDEPYAFLQDVRNLGNISANEVIELISPYVDLIQKAKEKRLCCVDFVLSVKPYTQLEDVGFSVRAFNCLKRAGFNTIEEVMAKIDFDSDEHFAFLSCVRNLGSKCVDEVVDYITSCDKYQALLKTFQENENADRKDDLTDNKRAEGSSAKHRSPLEKHISVAESAKDASKDFAEKQVNIVHKDR